MDPRRGHGFGWTTPCPADGVASSRAHVEALCAAYFPAAAGYAVARRELGDGLRLAVTRGDFHAEVEVADGQRRGAPRVHLRGSAGSRRIAATERAASDWVEGMRVALAVIAGLGFVACACAQLLLTPPRITIDVLNVLGGLLLVVMLIVLTMTGAGVGGWLGEQVAAGRWALTLDAVERDTDLRADLQRWRALVRSLAHHRDALAGARGLPFRSEAGLDLGLALEA
jgi:hypothetical protein